MSDDAVPATSRDRGRPGFLTTVVGCFTVLVLVPVLVVGTYLAAAVAFTGWPPNLNPFAEETVDRTGASVLKSLTEISEYHAATGHYETVVDVEKDVRFVPGWLNGERVLYVGKGDVDAVVDFSELDERRVELSEDGTTVTVTLPQPTVDEPTLDVADSYIAHRDEGLVNRFQGSEVEREAQLRAIEQMTSAATGEGLLVDLAKENTTAMLRGLFGSLGYTDVTVTFDDEAR
ncbi:DUF4230 domain-containing protein [Ornithinimicrobium tianjinense]|uniref:DUF4230 domain-containing protein n=1 Tax=Ornithinimicrobium tianjinense TaxID=1195761 RepID=A0A917BEY6_9MICO|nr:DUF4230 domain-containing protein [Ornithinimicrobium tianjinense]GGF40155.1 hypothetical protein GCM10011366_04730 [Ornithinimicrobium tianjinense]